MTQKTARAREKVSVTLERSLMDEVRSATDNVSAFVNDAIRRKLYFARLDAELDRLAAEGVRPDPAGVRWLSERVDATRRRLARRRSRSTTAS
jgi:post-segregation antitoxin (ccd killing protein)